MIIEKTAARKSIAVILALALFGSAPTAALAQTRGAAATGAVGYVPAGIGSFNPNAAMISAPVVLPNFTLAPSLTQTGAPSVVPTLGATLKPESLGAATPVFVQPAVERHPVINLLNGLQQKGVQLPETLSTREDAAKLIAAANSMPDGSAKQSMLAMAKQIEAANKAQGGESAELGKIYDAAGARGESESAPVMGRWARFIAPLAKLVGAGGGVTESKQPANRDDHKVKIADLRYVPSPAQLPESTKKVPAADQQIVGQDGALKAIKFGLQMPGRHYNLFVAGPEGSGRETALRHVLADVARNMPTPGDLVAATNFAEKDKPVVLELAPGAGAAFVKGVKKFVSMMKQVLPEQLNSGEIGAAKQQIIAQVQENGAKREQDFHDAVKKIALSHGFGIEFFAKPSGEGKMMVGLKLTREGKEIDPAKVPELIAAGAFTQEQFDAASKERDAKFPAVMDEFRSVMEETQKELMAAQEQIGQLESQAVGAVAETVGEGLMRMVKPQVKPTQEMIDLDAAHKAWSKTFQERLSAVKSGEFSVVLAQTQGGITPVMTYKGQPMVSQEVLDAIKADGISEAQIQEALEAVNSKVGPLMKEFQQKMMAHMAAMKKAAAARPDAKPTVEQMKAVAYVQSLLQFSAQNYQIFMGRPSSPADEDGEGGIQEAPGQKPIDAQDFFEVSALSNNAATKGAPVVWVTNPTYENIFGEADDNRRTMIIPGVGLMKGGAPGGPTLKGGAIQKANGGFLVLNVMDALREPGVWQSLMAAVRSGEAEIADDGLRGLMMGKGSTYHVPSKVKIVLLGSPSLRMLIAQHDQDFALNFQSVANFESTLKVSEESVAGYVQFFKKAVSSLAYELKQEVMDLTQDAMSALVEHGARLADSHKKLTAQFGALYGTIREATYWAQQAGRAEVRREDVEKALQEKQDREETYRRHLIEIYKDNVFVVETSGYKVGQINGLAVMGTFGVPMRITVVPSAAAGAGGIISVDRQAGPDQTGSSFNKALGVVEGFLQNLFAQQSAFPARLSISYEQNYGGIDGDSATSTEMYAILSALSGVPIGQNFAVTGSADQFGNVQAIGGVNHKIEGYFELAKSRGLTGDQGILIPRSNVADLQLSPEVVQAVKDGKFHIYAVDHVSQGIEILTGVAYSEVVAKAKVTLEGMGKGKAAPAGAKRR